MKTPSKERGCEGKTKLGHNPHASVYAVRLAIRHKKKYGVYLCPHCGDHHLTTKLEKKDQYAPLVYVTGDYKEAP